MKQAAITSEKGHWKRMQKNQILERCSKKSENFQVELGAHVMQTKLKRGSSQQKILSKLSYQESFIVRYPIFSFVHHHILPLMHFEMKNSWK